jgi:hypothetical protein
LIQSLFQNLGILPIWATDNPFVLMGKHQILTLELERMVVTEE